MHPALVLAIAVFVGCVIVGALVRWLEEGDDRRFRRLAALAAALALGVVVLGAYVRLSDAGLGCPDWPGCYGHPTPAHASEHIAAAEQDAPFGPVSMAKAWKEMAHRYLAASLGLLILALAIGAWRKRLQAPARARLALLLLGVVLLQGAFGAWTVTLLLRPAIVTGHLIGGMTTLALLGCLALLPPGRRAAPRLLPEPRGLRSVRAAATLALGALAVQIMLGGWVSTNHAALACPDLPLCQRALVPPMNFGDAFHLMRPLGMAADGEPLPFAALTAIHWTHRMFALVATVAIARCMLRAYFAPGLRWLALGLGSALLAQLALGISNVHYGLPLAVAVAHNAGAATLLLVLVAIRMRAGRAVRSVVEEVTPCKPASPSHVSPPACASTGH
ncbi:COX15/CtaA family protein [Derxia gummosa]|uniref:COX15/CtaA family protein n=1 Tax=Derxia gummosa DSM 723 TaxID=1121388 RepID=A0A8B6XBT0_9BURK|nr:COX15/CtaA family protein [Derxia gummosa]